MSQQYETHGLDTQKAVYFYEQDFYPLSNFSAFQVHIAGVDFPTAEHAYHYFKFEDNPEIQELILNARSAHDAFTMAQGLKAYVRKDWNDLKETIMQYILLHKVIQHPYVFKKLLQVGDRTPVENSWRDDYWGIGPNGDGQNRLGRLWGHIIYNIKKCDQYYVQAHLAGMIKELEDELGTSSDDFLD